MLRSLWQDNIEVVKAENGILRRKLQSKTEGLMIISKEVETLKNELNQTKTLNEHLMNPVRNSITLTGLLPTNRTNATRHGY